MGKLKSKQKEIENKYSKWVLTIQQVKGTSLPVESEIVNIFEEISSKYVFQKEIGSEEKKEHYQCCFSSKERQRQSTLLNKLVKLSGCKKTMFQVDRMRGTWEESFKYCTKNEFRVGENFYTNVEFYSGKDIEFLNNEYERYEWQNCLLDIIYDFEINKFKKANDRDIIWIYDPNGNCGKSKFIKWLSLNNANQVVKISCNTEAQLRAAVISAGSRKLYVVDLPRSLPMTYQYKEKLAGMLAAIEETKNGYLSSAMYGEYKEIYFEPPHIIILSNEVCPRQFMSEDRWKVYMLTNYQLVNLSAKNTIETESLDKVYQKS